MSRLLEGLVEVIRGSEMSAFRGMAARKAWLIAAAA
jgi:hypothetical protein